MKPPISRHSVCYSFTLFALCLLQACSPSFAYKEKAVPETVNLSQRLQSLFNHTKVVCFGRYVLTVPHEAELIWGEASVADSMEFIHGGLEASQKRVAADIAKIKHGSDTAEIT